MRSEDNLFISLYNYRLCEEDFFTAALSYVLQLENKKIARFILRKLKALSEEDNEEIYVKVQPTLGKTNKRPDIQLSGKNFIVLIENKLGSGPSGSYTEDGEYSEQTKYYKKYLDSLDDSKYRTRKLIKITKDFQQKGCEDRWLYWSKIYEWIKEVEKDMDVLSKQYVQAFLKFMEVLYMNPVQFRQEDIAILSRYRLVREEIWRILEDTVTAIHDQYRFNSDNRGSFGQEDKDWHYCQSRSLNTNTNQPAKFALYIYFGGSEMYGLLIPAVFFWEQGIHPGFLEELKKSGYEYRQDWKGGYKELQLEDDFLELSSPEQKKRIKDAFLTEMRSLFGG